MSMIFEYEEELLRADAPIKDFELVNYILAAALKADKIPAIDLGMVLTYLDTV